MFLLGSIVLREANVGERLVRDWRLIVEVRLDCFPLGRLFSKIVIDHPEPAVLVDHA